MSKLIKLKSLAVMAMCAMGAFFAASCTSDEFFGIEEEADAVAFSTLTKIANSAEYLEYQTQAFLLQLELCSIDTTRKVKVGVIDGKPLYSLDEVKSISSFLEARQKLIETYPNFENATFAEKKQIQNIAILNNKSLRLFATPNVLARTKGSNPETMAGLWISRMCNGENTGYYYDSSEGCYRHRSNVENVPGFQPGDYYTYEMNVFQDSYEAIAAARSKSINTEKETGGWGWSDDSAISIYHEQATISMMSFPGFRGNPLPSYDFHFHPSGDLCPSEYDFSSGHNIYHYIFDYEGNYSCFWQ